MEIVITRIAIIRVSLLSYLWFSRPSFWKPAHAFSPAHTHSRAPENIPSYSLDLTSQGMPCSPMEPLSSAFHLGSQTPEVRVWKKFPSLPILRQGVQHHSYLRQRSEPDKELVGSENGWEVEQNKPIVQFFPLSPSSLSLLSSLNSDQH